MSIKSEVINNLAKQGIVRADSALAYEIVKLNFKVNFAIVVTVVASLCDVLYHCYHK
jgi:hypothetical protein